MKPIQAAFSLVEMLVVLTLVAVILGITVPHFRGFFTARELQNAASLFENLVDETYSRARSEQNIVGLKIESGKLSTFTCEYLTDADGNITGCDGAPLEEEVEWEGRSVGSALKVTFDTPFNIYRTPPHGDIIQVLPHSYSGGKKEFNITHDTTGDEVAFTLYQLSGLLEQQP